MLGFININKEKGVSSTYVVNKIKHRLKTKCGHMGTFDPLASGVLPVGIGQATRMFDILLDKEKTYLAEFDFSFTTLSLDLETEPYMRSKRLPSEAEVLTAARAQVGEIMQVPPAYSAKFVDGKRSYKLARRGVTVELEPKKVLITAVDLVKKTGEAKYLFEINCSSGTYIRSIVRDMADSMGVCGVMTDLKRVKSGKFAIENSVTLEEFLSAKNPSDYIIKPENAIDLPVIVLDSQTSTRLINGLPVFVEYADGLYKLYSEAAFWGFATISGGLLKMKAYVRDL